MAAYPETILVRRKEPAAPSRHRRPAPASPKIFATESSTTEDGERREGVEASYAVAARAASDTAAETLRLEAWRIARRLSRAWQVGGASSTAKAADRWLARRFGRCDDPLRHALVASLALVAGPPDLSEALTVLYTAAHARLARSLIRAAPYHIDFYAKDLAFVCGALAPAGALWLGLPTSRAATVRLTHAKKAAGLLWRATRAAEGSETLALARDAGLKPWAELHLDTRNLGEFHAEGFERMYRRLAALLRQRPDLAGVHGASWLYDPALETISPSLGFTAEPARSGGAALVRLGVDPVQTAYAVARSPVRRELWRQGRYQPACYGLYWPRKRLLAWDEARG